MSQVSQAWLVGVHDELVGCGPGYGYVGTGWVYRVGNTGTPSSPAPRTYTAKQPHDSGAGPGTPLQGVWSGWS